MICRCCKKRIVGKPILFLPKMPSRAQEFPTKETLQNDKPVDLELYQCQYCGLIQITSDPVPYYKDVIRASGVSDELKEYRTHFFDTFIKNNHLTGKKIVEIGTGCGEFLEIMSLLPVQAYGIEHSQKFVEICQSKNLKVQKGYPNRKERFEHAPFDAFFVMNYLEHSPDPEEFIQGIYNNTTEDAVGLIEVPNFDMIVKNEMFSEFIQDHLMYFTKETLSFLLNKCGFEVLECCSVWHDYCLSAVVKKRRQTDLSALNIKKQQIVFEINSYIDEVQKKGRVVVWGAGHQALAVIAIAGIENKIDYIVDSADFKQEKYTPGTHIIIHSPQFFWDDEEISSVIIMAASYSDEVYRTISNHGKNVSIAILRETGLVIYD